MKRRKIVGNKTGVDYRCSVIRHMCLFILPNLLLLPESLGHVLLGGVRQDGHDDGFASGGCFFFAKLDRYGRRSRSRSRNPD